MPKATTIKWEMIMRTAGNVVAFLVVVAHSAWAQEEPSVVELKGALESTVRALDSCHIVGAFRGSQDSLREPTAPKPRVTFLDLWLSGDYAQIRMSPSVGVKGNWWEDPSFSPLQTPLTAADVDKKPGMKTCYRPSGDFYWVESRLIDSKSSPDFTSLYSRSQSLKPPQVFHLPLVQLNRAWEVDRQGSWLAVNFLGEASEETWRIVGIETVEGRKMIVVEIPQREALKAKLERHEGILDLAPIWKVWFSTDPAEGHFPARIEQGMRYNYGGKEYPYERPANLVRSSVIFEAHDIKKYADGLYYPSWGKQETYLPRPEAATGFSPDSIVDQLLKDGKYVDNQEYELATRREWRVLKLETIKPTTQLWIEPPTRSCVYDVDTNARFINGVSEAESRKILGLDTPNEPEILKPRFPSRLLWILASVNVIAVTLLILRFFVFRKRSP